MKRIVIIHGPIATGKSTLTEMLRKKLPSYSYVDRPFIKRGLKPAGKEIALKLSKEASYFLIKELMKIQQNMIVEEINPESMKNKMGKDIENNNYELISFFTTCKLETAIKRDMKRSSKTAGKRLVTKIHREYAKPAEYEIVIDTEKLSINQCITKMIKRINS